MVKEDLICNKWWLLIEVIERVEMDVKVSFKFFILFLNYLNFIGLFYRKIRLDLYILSKI